MKEVSTRLVLDLSGGVGTPSLGNPSFIVTHG